MCRNVDLWPADWGWWLTPKRRYQPGNRWGWGWRAAQQVLAWENYLRDVHIHGVPHITSKLPWFDVFFSRSPESVAYIFCWDVEKWDQTGAAKRAGPRVAPAPVPEPDSDQLVVPLSLPPHVDIPRAAPMFVYLAPGGRCRHPAQLTILVLCTGAHSPW